MNWNGLGRAVPNTHHWLALLAISGLAMPASAFNFSIGGVEGGLTTRVTLGAGWRIEDRDEDLIGKLNIEGQQTLCQSDDCLSLSGDPEPNQRLIDARGDYSAHVFDDGNLNYDKGDAIAALAKLKANLNLGWRDFTLKVTGISFFDAINTNFDETHPNTLFQPAQTRRSNEVEGRVGTRTELREAFLSWGGVLRRPLRQHHHRCSAYSLGRSQHSSPEHLGRYQSQGRDPCKTAGSGIGRNCRPNRDGPVRRRPIAGLFSGGVLPVPLGSLTAGAARQLFFKCRHHRWHLHHSGSGPVC